MIVGQTVDGRLGYWVEKMQVAEGGQEPATTEASAEAARVRRHVQRRHWVTNWEEAPERGGVPGAAHGKAVVGTVLYRQVHETEGAGLAQPVRVEDDTTAILTVMVGTMPLVREVIERHGGPVDHQITNRDVVKIGVRGRDRIAVFGLRIEGNSRGIPGGTIQRSTLL